MKAYILSVKNDDDQGQQIVFAKTAREAKNNWHWYLNADIFLDKLVHRAPEFDDMENATELELMTKQWQEGWRWFDYNDVPDVETENIKDFENWYKKKIVEVSDD